MCRIDPPRTAGPSHAVSQSQPDARPASVPASATTKRGLLGGLRLTWNLIGTFFKAVWRSVCPRPDPKMTLLVHGDARGRPMSAIPDRQFKAIGVTPPSQNRIATEVNSQRVDEAGARRLLTRGCVKVVTRQQAKDIQTDACLTGLDFAKAGMRGWKSVESTVYLDLIKKNVDILKGRLSEEGLALEMRKAYLSGLSKNEQIIAENPASELIRGIDCVKPGGKIHDPQSGLKGNVFYHPATREVVVGFSGAQTASDCVKCFDAMAGYIPSNFAKADEVVGRMQEQLRQINARSGPDEQISLRVVGHSMGGGIAAYVGARHEVPFATFNGLKLGKGLLESVGEEKAAKAETLGKRYVSEGDWVGDTRGGSGFTAWAFKGLDSARYLGKGYLIPREYDRLVQSRDKDADTHNSPVSILKDLAKGQAYEEAPIPEGVDG